ncbi:TonB-dependent receptor domain-containing protein [Olivibacter sitiensis]|uniref:TonB-dependent receptor domain-containing protein n=1 Tax=Olivibacter sitiensis TaxID=376470 RepID=UPI00146FB439|nr:TonB-dependent receptor [Olivibacter sitiensis]
MTKLNLTQFPNGTIDNPYYVIENNQQSDDRNRFVGNASLSYQLTDWLEVYGRVAVDSYNYIMEERQTDLIRVPARYNIRNVAFTEANYDLMFNYNKDITEKFNTSGVFGTNIRRSKNQSIYNSTSGGLIVKDLYAINNSVANPPAATETFTKIGVNGYFGSLSLGYDKTYYLDVTGRVDQSSTLPEKNNTYFYPSVAASFVFSELLHSSVLSFGKLRLNYAEVGNDAQAQSLFDVLNKSAYAFGSAQRYSVNDTKNNENLKLESTRSWEAGVETSFLNGRVSYNASLYNTNTLNQIMPVSVTAATGYTRKYVNAGDVRNRGIEMTLSGKPLVKQGFSWTIDLNWSMNRSKVMSLYEGVNNLNLGNYSTDMSLNATAGRPFGEWRGSDFVYLDGKPVINQTDGKYLKSDATSVLGDMNPDWIGGLMNTFTYKNLSFKFLIDMQTGGDIFSEDMAIGTRNGLYSNTTGLNELGNPMRDPISAGGGLLLDGVAPDGTVNTIRTEMRDRNHALGSPSAPSVMFLYDASYVKLREVSLSYTLPSKFVQRYGIFGAQVSLIGANLWIIHKNLPYADPEAGIAGGTLQGFQSGVFPSTRNFGFNLKLNF